MKSRLLKDELHTGHELDPATLTPPLTHRMGEGVRRTGAGWFVGRIGVIALIVAAGGSARAQWHPVAPAPVLSSSGQFVVFSAPPTAPISPLRRLASNTNYISLEPTLLVVSCERIKQRLWAALGVRGPWQGKICLDLHPARSADEGITVVTDRSPGRWNYRVVLPDLLARDRFVRAIVQVLLIEIANRNAGTHAAEIPDWLAEGLSEELRASGETEFMLPPPRWNVHGLTISPEIVNARWADPLARAQQELRTRPPLTFEQLSWPAEGQLAGEAGEVYRCNAHVFVDLLLRLPDGPACLRTMLDELPRCYNWQIAFLHAFGSHFQNLLAVEKWWALQLVQFTGHDLSQTWPPDESWRKLDQIVRSPVDVRTDKSDLPLHTQVSLQTIIREWDRERQTRILQQKLAELEGVRLRMAPAMASLADEYRGLIQMYLHKRSSFSLGIFFGRRLNVNSDAVAEEAVRQLNTLDQRREALRPMDKTNVTAATTPPLP